MTAELKWNWKTKSIKPQLLVKISIFYSRQSRSEITEGAVRVCQLQIQLILKTAPELIVFYSQDLLMHFSVSHGQRETVTVTTETHFKYACTGLRRHQHVCAEHTRYCMRSWNTSTEQAVICPWQATTVWSVYLSRRCAVSLRGCSEWGAEMARWHHTEGPGRLCQSCRSPNYRLALPASPAISAPLRGSALSQQLPEPQKMSWIWALMGGVHTWRHQFLWKAHTGHKSMDRKQDMAAKMKEHL